MSETKERLYKCAYKHCLHEGEKVGALESVVIGGQHYHPDCAQLKSDISEMRRLYKEGIDPKVNMAALSTVLNRILFEQKLPVDYVMFAIQSFANRKNKIKSPFVLLYLHKNELMKKQWLKSKENVYHEN